MGIAGGYKRLQGVRKGHKSYTGLQEVKRGYKKLK